MAKQRIARAWVTSILFFFALALLPGVQARAQEKYPSRNIEVVIPWAPGGSADVFGRIFAEELAKVLKVAVTSTNKPGATGTSGAVGVAGAKKDGHTLMVNTISAMILAKFTLPDVPFDTLKDFAAITNIAVSPSIIFVKADSPLKTLEDLISAAKKKPGDLTFATAGVGSDNHFNTEQFMLLSKIKCTHVPYKSGGEAITAVLGGHQDFGTSVVASVASQLKAGTLRGLVHSGSKRLDSFPDIPTYAEKGYTQYFFSNWAGLFAPAGVSRQVVDTLSRASEKAINSKDFITRMEKMGAQPAYMTPGEFKTYLENGLKAAEALAKQAGISPQK